MSENTPTQYTETASGIIIVCEPAGNYSEPSAYLGTSITKALHDYYSLTTNREKLDVLKWIVAQPDFSELQRISTAENRIFTLYENQYNEILQTGELPNNLQIARKFVANGYDVFLLSNPKAIKSADFIISQKGKLFYVEGKTSTGGSSLIHRFDKGARQSDRIAVNFIDVKLSTNDITTNVKQAFVNNGNLHTLYLFKGSRIIIVTRTESESSNFYKKFCKVWTKNK